ncbi:hypothetical protein V8E53_001858 [Lactarius tabidus]
MCQTVVVTSCPRRRLNALTSVSHQPAGDPNRRVENLQMDMMDTHLASTDIARIGRPRGFLSEPALVHCDLKLLQRQEHTREMNGITGSLQKAAWLQSDIEGIRSNSGQYPISNFVTPPLSNMRNILQAKTTCQIL